MSPRRRFLHLERDRGVVEAPEAKPLAPERFDNVERPVERADEAPVATGAGLDRFAAATASPRVELGRPDRPVSHRCSACERENGRFDETCRYCGARLDTPEQRAFNERLAAERASLEEAQRAEAEAVAQRRRAEAEEAERERHALAESVARELLSSRKGFEWDDPWAEETAAPGDRLIGLLGWPARSFARLILLGIAALWLWIGLGGYGGPWYRVLWLGLSFGLFWAFLPRFWRRR